MFLFTRRHLVFTVYIACDFVLRGVLKARDDLKVYDSALSKFLSQLIKSNPSSRKRRRRSVYATANNDVNKHFFRNNCNKNEIQFIKLNSEGLTKKSPTRDDGIEIHIKVSLSLSACFVFSVFFKAMSIGTRNLRDLISFSLEVEIRKELSRKLKASTSPSRCEVRSSELS